MGSLVQTDELLELLADMYLNYTYDEFRESVTFIEFVERYMRGVEFQCQFLNGKNK